MRIASLRHPGTPISELVEKNFLPSPPTAPSTLVEEGSVRPGTPELAEEATLLSSAARSRQSISEETSSGESTPMVSRGSGGDAECGDETLLPAPSVSDASHTAATEVEGAAAAVAGCAARGVCSRPSQDDGLEGSTGGPQPLTELEDSETAVPEEAREDGTAFTDAVEGGQQWWCDQQPRWGADWAAAGGECSDPDRQSAPGLAGSPASERDVEESPASKEAATSWRREEPSSPATVCDEATRVFPRVGCWAARSDSGSSCSERGSEERSQCRRPRPQSSWRIGSLMRAAASEPAFAVDSGHSDGDSGQRRRLDREEQGAPAESCSAAPHQKVHPGDERAEIQQASSAATPSTALESWPLVLPMAFGDRRRSWQRGSGGGSLSFVPLVVKPLLLLRQ